MRIILSLSFLMASLAMQAQSYTITERVCRMWIDNPSRTVEVLLLDRIDWRKVGSNSDEYEFSDGISTIRLRDAYLANYPTVDSLISQIEAWIDSCAIPPNLWPIQVCDTSNITVNGVVTDAATDASNDGEIAITTYGGQSPYTYAWTGPGGYTSTDEDITGLDDGTYTVTVTDANACTGSQSFEVGIAACDGVTITFTATVTDEVTEGAEDGEIEINTTSGGTGPYTYAWTGPNGYTSSSEDITDLADGDYTVTATDANGCTGDSTFTVGPGFPCSVTNITFTAVVTDESIDQQNDGEIDLTTAGGAVPYTWSWRGPKGYTASTEDISNLGDGNYTVTATDANNCQGDTTFTIDPGPTICDTSNILFNAVVVDETIEGLEDGSIDLTTYGGTPPYTWDWRGPTGFRETTEDISNLADGDYTVTVTDNNGCQGDTTYTIDPGFPCDTTNIGFVAVITGATDSVTANGEIDLTTYGGSKVYTWAWTGPGGYTATTEDITGLLNGEYTVTATDSNNCFSDTTLTVGVPCDTTTIAFNSVITDESVLGANDGEIDLTTYGGDGSYTWAWDDGPTTEDRTGLGGVADYIVTATDGNGCTGTDTFTINIDYCDTVTIAVVADICSEDLDGFNDGCIDITPSGGSGQYSFAWTGPNAYTSTDEDITNLEPGNYFVTVTDTVNGCTYPATDTFTIDAGVTELVLNQRSIDLDGTSEYVSVADADNLSMTDGAGNDIPFSIAFWFNSAVTTNGMAITKYDVSASADEYYVLINDQAADGDTDLSAFLTTSDGSKYIGCNPCFPNIGAEPLNQWYHGVITYDGSETSAGIKGYVNGVLGSPTTSQVLPYSGMSNTATPAIIGVEYNGPTYYNGKLDQVCIFRNVELSLEEIKELMAIREVTQHSRADSLVMYFEFDDTDSSNICGIADLSDSGNKGTMQNGTYSDLVDCVTWPYSYQMDTSSALAQSPLTFANLTPMQSSVEADSAFGGFSYNFETTEYIQISQTDDHLFLNQAKTADTSFTFSAYFYIDAEISGSGTDAIWESRTNFPNFNGYRLYWSHASNNLLFQLNDDGIGNQITVRSRALRLDTWYHVAITYDGSADTSGLELYINGINSYQTKTINNYTKQSAYSEDMVFGYDLASLPTVNEMDGKLANIAIWKGVELNSTEVKELYNAHGPVNPLTHSRGDDLTSFYDGQYGTQADSIYDQAGTPNNGINVNMDVSDFSYEYPREIFDADTAGSVSFDGNAEWIDFGDVLDFGDSSGVGLSFWFNTSASASNQMIYTKQTSGDVDYLTAYIRATGEILVDFSVDAAGNRLTFETNTTWNDGEWHHCFIFWNRSPSPPRTQIIYIDGVEQALTTSNDVGDLSLNFNAAGSTIIGARDISASRLPFAGNIYGVSVHLCACDWSFTSPEIRCYVQELYNDGSPININDAVTGTTVDGYWLLNQREDLESAGGVIDQINSNNGTATNMTNAANKITTLYPTN